MKKYINTFLLVFILNCCSSTKPTWVNNLEDDAQYYQGIGRVSIRDNNYRQKAFQAAESKHFHSLRHTFAVRKLIQNVSIYTLKLLMGHASVTTTEVYSNMNLKRVAQDFPTLVTSYLKTIEFGSGDTFSGDTNYTIGNYMPVY